MNEQEKPKNLGGRPQEYNRIEIGKKFVQWAKDHPDCLTVPHFTTQNGLTTSRLLAWYNEDEGFREYYKEAKEQIGINRLNATRITETEETNLGKKALDKTIYLRHVNNFDPDKRQFDREEKAYEAQLKSESLKEVAPPKVVFEVNYKNDSDNPVQISPKSLPDTTTTSTE